MWKSYPPPGIKPVIARDTTYGVSYLTGTTHGSNVTIPSIAFGPTGMEPEASSEE
jgi:hypothetical protein